MAPLRKIIRRYTTISAVIDILQREELPLLDPQSWDDRNDRYFMAIYKEKKSLGGLYGACAAQCSETYHHWRVFTGTADGACLELKRAPLEKALRSLEGIRFGPVEYLRLDQAEALSPRDVDRLPFVKRIGFAAEEEYRIIAETMEQQQSAVSIELPHSLIGRIYLNPWLPASIAVSVIAVLKRLSKRDELEVQRSHLINSSRWKKVGDNVAGRKNASPRVKPKSKGL